MEGDDDWNITTLLTKDEYLEQVKVLLIPWSLATGLDKVQKLEQIAPTCSLYRWQVVFINDTNADLYPYSIRYSSTLYQSWRMLTKQAPSEMGKENSSFFCSDYLRSNEKFNLWHNSTYYVDVNTTFKSFPGSYYNALASLIDDYRKPFFREINARVTWNPNTIRYNVRHQNSDAYRTLSNETTYSEYFFAPSHQAYLAQKEQAERERQRQEETERERQRQQEAERERQRQRQQETYCPHERYGRCPFKAYSNNCNYKHRYDYTKTGGGSTGTGTGNSWGNSWSNSWGGTGTGTGGGWGSGSTGTGTGGGSTGTGAGGAGRSGSTGTGTGGGWGGTDRRAAQRKMLQTKALATLSWALDRKDLTLEGLNDPDRCKKVKILVLKNWHSDKTGENAEKIEKAKTRLLETEGYKESDFNISDDSLIDSAIRHTDFRGKSESFLRAALSDKTSTNATKIELERLRTKLKNDLILAKITQVITDALSQFDLLSSGASGH